MKKFLLIGVVLPLVAVWLGCGGSDSPTDPDNGGTPGPQRITANTTAGAPSMTNANDALWNAVTATAVDLATTNSPKLTPLESQAAPDSIYLKAIVDAGRLYLRLEFTNDSLNLLKDYHSVNNAALNFTQNFFSNEDQIFVMFAGLPDNTWDVWNWRSLETAPARLAEGYRYDGTLPMSRDAGGQVVAIPNPPFSASRPRYVHANGPNFTGEILYLPDTVSLSPNWDDPDDWTVGQIVQAFIIDTAVYWRVQPDSAYASSRWDIFSIHNYNSTTNRLAVVLSRLLNTTYGDDLVLTDSVKVKIGILDDQDDINVQGSRRGFSNEFWLIL